MPALLTRNYCSIGELFKLYHQQFNHIHIYTHIQIHRRNNIYIYIYIYVNALAPL